MPVSCVRAVDSKTPFCSQQIICTETDIFFEFFYTPHYMKDIK